MVFRSIVSQLAKANEKFMYGAVREGGRARESYFLIPHASINILMPFSSTV